MNATHRLLVSRLVFTTMALLVLTTATGVAAKSASAAAAALATAAATADLSVIVQAANVGELTYAAAVHNGGPDPATNVSLVMTVPEGVIPMSVTPDGLCAFNEAGTAANCSLGSIPSGDTTTVTIVVHAISTGVKTAIATASATEAEPTPGDNTHSASVTVMTVGISEVSVTLADGPDPLRVGQTLTYTAVVRNNGDDDARNVVLSVVLPAGVTFESAKSDRGRCSHQSRLVTCRLDQFSVGAASTATIQIVPTASGFLYAAAGVALSTPDPDFKNNSAAVRTWVSP